MISDRGHGPPPRIDQAPHCERCGVTVDPYGTDVLERLAEASGWHEFHTLVDLLTLEEVAEPGYFAEGWSVRDLVGHVGAWLAEAGQLFEQMGVGHTWKASSTSTRPTPASSS